YVIEELIGHIVNDGKLTVVDRANLETIRQEMNFQLSGEVSNESMQAIGQKLGAQSIISGQIIDSGAGIRLRIRIISIESAQVPGIYSANLTQDNRLTHLTRTVAPAQSASAQTASAIPAANRGGNPLFPVDGVTIGVTTVEELKRLGTRATNIDSNTKQPYHYYIINGVNVWYHSYNYAQNYYIYRSNKIPPKWEAAGLTFDKSYNEWIALANSYGWNVRVSKEPQVGKHQNRDTFVAALVFTYTANNILHTIELNFNYSNFTRASDKNTLYSISVRGAPAR
ncbi:MAG: penicillin-binding protein activator LpoB, partial [Treponema sp.]|nr:penicillin-binding protein activator LpoB [Treponema sp.]